jgi:hypothetical protein
MQQDIGCPEPASLAARMLGIPGDRTAHQLQLAPLDALIIAVAPVPDGVGRERDEDPLAAVLDGREPFGLRRQGSRGYAFQVEFALLVGARRLETGKADERQHLAQSMDEYDARNRLQPRICVRVPEGRGNASAKNGLSGSSLPRVPEARSNISNSACRTGTIAAAEPPRRRSISAIASSSLSQERARRL